MPPTARVAVVLLWVAWIISACMVLVRAIRLGGLDTATLAGLAALLVQSVIFYFVGRGSNAARIALLVVILLGLPSLLVLHHTVGLIVRHLPMSALISLVDLALKVFACVLLFTPTARLWFSRSQVTGGAVDP
jgi:hypothetical protein